MRFTPRRIGGQRQHPLGEAAAGQEPLLDHFRRAGARQDLGVLALMVVGGGRQRNQQRWLPCRRQLRQRRRPGAGDDQIRGSYFTSHGEQERLHPGLEARPPVPVADVFQIALSCLMRDRQPARLRLPTAAPPPPWPC